MSTVIKEDYAEIDFTESCSVTTDLKGYESEQDKADKRQKPIDALIHLFGEDLTELQDRMPPWRLNSLITLIFEEANACQAGRQSKAELGEAIINYFEKEKQFIAERETQLADAEMIE